MHKPLPRLAILASGRGSNAAALMRACRSGLVPAELVLVLCDRPGAGFLAEAAAQGYPTVVEPRQGRSREAQEAALLAQLQARGVGLLLLAGYMRLLSAAFLAAFAAPVLNIHPALLPEFPGLQAGERQVRAGRLVLGASVHQVDAGMDTGPVILQGSLLAQPQQSEATLLSRLRTEVEHVIYPRAVRLFLDRWAADGV